MSNLKIYKASAGSGKTYTLALEYIKELLLSPSDHAFKHILAVTFTKDATGEMKERILSELYALAFSCRDSEGFLRSVSEALKAAGKPMDDKLIQAKSKALLLNILKNYSRLFITTIDSFFQKVLRNLARELGKGSKFNLEMNSMKVLKDAVQSMIEHANENPQVLDWLTTYIENKLDEGGNWRIDREILDFSTCIFNEYFQEHEFILKKQLEENPKVFEELWNQHAILQKEYKDFFQKAYATVQSQMDEHPLDLSDFSRSGVVIKLFKKLAEGDFGNVDPHSKTVTDCLVDPEKWPSAKSKKKDIIIALAGQRWMALLNECLANLRKYDTSRMITNNIHQLGLVWDITNEISRQNAENNRFMLADTALFLNRMVDNSDASFIYEKIGAEVKHVMIDEFQDTSRLQWKNFKVLLSEILANNYFSLIVGDVKQSIYRWRNGDWSILDGIDRELPVQRCNLNKNFRSEPQIVSFNNQFFTESALVLNEKYTSEFGKQQSSPFLNAYQSSEVQQETTRKEAGGFVSVELFPEKTENANYDSLIMENLIKRIQQLHEKGIPANEICILTRENSSIIQLAEYLASAKLQYPELSIKNYLNIVSNEAFQLRSSPALKIIIESLRVLAKPENPVHKAQLRFFLEKSKLNVELADLDTQLTLLPLFELTGYLYRLFNLVSISGQSSYLFAFYDALLLYLKDSPADIHSFLPYWDDELNRKTVSAGTSVEGIRVMTIHKSKGLQFHTVILPFCDWNLNPRNPVTWCGSKEGLYDLELLPVKYSSKMSDTVFAGEYELETGQSWMDNLNLLYVAFTRAEQNLIIFGKEKKKLESVQDVKTVSDLLLLTLVAKKTTDNESDNFFLEQGDLIAYTQSEKKHTDNVLKQVPHSMNACFVNKAFDSQKSIFRQSNKSREFVNPDIKPKEEYVSHGNVMHTLFSYIKTLDDTENAVERLCFDGLILPEEKEQYSENIRQAVRDSQTGNWFSGKYKVYNECALLVEENGTVTTKRPDRVLLTADETILIDYKFGEERPAHLKQMKQYLQLMEQMNYRGISGYIWYVKDNKVISL